MRVGKKQVKGILKADDWTRIYDSGELAAAATSVTISGLTGDTHEVYKLVCRFVGGGDVSFYIRPNNDSGSNYGLQAARATTSTADAYRSTGQATFYAGYTNVAGKLNLVEYDIYAKSGYPRIILGLHSYSITTTSYATIVLTGGVWNNTADELTSLVIYSDTTNGLGIGSRIELYAKRPST